MAMTDVLLALLARGPRHGYDLKRSYDEWFAGLRPLAFGQVYSTLARLQRDGLVEVAHTEGGDGPERVVYETTGAGREALRVWLEEPVEPNGTASDDLQRKVLAAHRLKEDVPALIARQRAAHLRAMRALTPSGELAATLTADLARLRLDAELRWLELAEERLARG
ncbi:PadR family transcriptional regulator [Spongisporangium articulatum]|uniref:PadR family transcriptional regulator n=1 Tax=Spongisporangium articulatum TaxID=3362603 RepID=A0ABW8AN06_9ACTN